MAWERLPVNYTDAVWSGLKRYSMVNNEDGTVSFQDVTVYSHKENSFFGAKDANRMNEALNTIMSMLENGTDLYSAFQDYFATQKTLFEDTATATQTGFEEYVADLKAEGDEIIETIKTDYRDEITEFEAAQEQVFNTWFELIKGQLSTDIAGNLQNQITSNGERITLLEYMAQNNDYVAPITTDDGDNSAILVDDLGNAILANWKYKIPVKSQNPGFAQKEIPPYNQSTQAGSKP